MNIILITTTIVFVLSSIIIFSCLIYELFNRKKLEQLNHNKKELYYKFCKYIIVCWLTCSFFGLWLVALTQNKN